MFISVTNISEPFLCSVICYNREKCDISLNRASDFVSSYFSGTIRVNFVQIFLLFIPANNDKIFNDAKNAKVSNKINNYIQR